LPEPSEIVGAWFNQLVLKTSKRFMAFRPFKSDISDHYSRVDEW
jgi:hypothetical protein